ncbi:MAG: hypothetical protein NTU80_05090 [Verrucomicrobia bacterium]|nr:hypothetical protein [Verrucomicrobiota bacterium]
MRRLRFLLGLAGALVLASGGLFAGVPSSATIDVATEADAAIGVSPVAERWSGEGFLPVRVRIENRANEARTWSFRFKVWTNYQEITTHEVSVSMGPREAGERVVYVPGNGRAESGRGAWGRVEVNGPGTSIGNGVNFVNQAGSDPIVITAVSAAQESALFVASNGAPGPKAELSVVDPAAWPADWRVWSPFQRVVLTEDEWTRLDGGRRAALRDWVLMGGVLQVFANRIGEPRSGPAEERIGFGAIRRSPLTLEAEERVKTGFVSLAEGVPTHPEALMPMSLPPELQLSTGRLGVSLFLVVFGILVGPINLFVFAPAGRRQRLFLTVPALSLAASVLLMVYIVVKDGFGGEGLQRGRVVLLPASNQAVVEQQQISRTGVLLGAQFALPAAVVLTQITDTLIGATLDQNAAYSRSENGASGDWFKSRRVQKQSVRQLVPTRARVERVAGGGGADAPPVVQSTVATKLKAFQYRDRDGVLWRADELEPGRRVTLKRAPGVGEERLAAGEFSALGGAAEGLAPIATHAAIRWREPVFVYCGPVMEARTP